MLVPHCARPILNPRLNAVVTLKRSILQSIRLLLLQVNDRAHLEASAQKLRLSLTVGAGQED